MTSAGAIRDRFLKALTEPLLGDALFDAVPDTVFFVKDSAGRYVVVNRTLVERVGLRSKADLIGRTAAEAFPGALGERIAQQDQAVLREGKPVHAALELHLYPDGTEGWCLTWKQPVHSAAGGVIGVTGLSRDVLPGAGASPETAGLSRALDHVRDNLDQPLRLPELAAMAGLSLFQFDARVRALYGISPGQFVTRARIEQACALLRQGRRSIGEIAQECGYGDQAAFTRQFRKLVGVTPMVYRNASGR
jgi:PAS domain S-box-containing protein